MTWRIRKFTVLETNIKSKSQVISADNAWKILLFFISFSLCVSFLTFFSSPLFMWDFRVGTLNVNTVRDELKRAKPMGWSEFCFQMLYGTPSVAIALMSTCLREGIFNCTKKNPLRCRFLNHQEPYPPSSQQQALPWGKISILRTRFPDMAEHRWATITGQDSVVHLHLKNGHSFGDQYNLCCGTSTWDPRQLWFPGT